MKTKESYQRSSAFICGFFVICLYLGSSLGRRGIGCNGLGAAVGLHLGFAMRFVNPWIIAMTVMLATFMEVLDTSVANVALPHIAGNLSASTDESTWVLTSYLVSNAIILPMGGWFSMLIGRKRFYMLCVALFTVASLLCGI